MVEASESVYNADDARDQAAEVFQIDGDRLERWMLKTLSGGLYSGKLWPDLAAWQGKQPLIEWLEELYGLREIPRGQGLFWQPTGKREKGTLLYLDAVWKI
jgi:hypothetical protein